MYVYTCMYVCMNICMCLYVYWSWSGGEGAWKWESCLYLSVLFDCARYVLLFVCLSFFVVTLMRMRCCISRGLSLNKWIYKSNLHSLILTTTWRASSQSDGSFKLQDFPSLSLLLCTTSQHQPAGSSYRMDVNAGVQTRLHMRNKEQTCLRRDRNHTFLLNSL